MAVNDQNIGLWAVDLAPKAPQELQTYPERLLKLSQATMVAEKDDGKRQATLFIKTPNGKFAACSLTSQRPTSTLDIFIMESDQFELSVEGNAHIHVIGCLSREMSDMLDGSDDEDGHAMGFAMGGSDEDEDGEDEDGQSGDDDEDEEPADMEGIEDMLERLTRPRTGPSAIVEEIQENEEAAEKPKKSPKLQAQQDKKSPKLQAAQEKSPKVAPAATPAGKKEKPAVPASEKKAVAADNKKANGPASEKKPAAAAKAAANGAGAEKKEKAAGKRKAADATTEEPQSKKPKTDNNAGKGTIKCSDGSCPKTFHNEAAMQQHAKAKHKAA